MSKKLVYSAIIFLILSTLIAQVKVIPSWKNIQTVFIASLFIIALGLGLLYFYKLWKSKNKRNLLYSSILILAFPFAWLMTMPIFDEPELVDEFQLGNKTIYVYNAYCFPPDSECECDTYGSFIYQKNQYLPIMYRLSKTDFYVGNVQLNNGELIVKASDICGKDLGKTKRIKL